MVVHSISATATPPRPSTTLSFRMKRNGGGLSSARRALSALGNNNALDNLRMAESLLTITQDKFMKKWNFDPVNVVPMAPGRFQWASVSATASQNLPSIAANRDISTCFTLPSQDISSRVPEPHSTTSPVTESHSTSSPVTTVTDTDSGVESDDSVIEERDTVTEEETSVTTKQTSITDYLNPRKRSLSHLEDSSLQLPASKKQLLLAN